EHLSFFHELNRLLAEKHYKLNLTILLNNNNGGRIFSFLQQASDGNRKYFEMLFGTPLHLDFKKTIEMYDGTYRQVKTETSLKEVLTKSYQESGLSVIEVKTDRTENMKWHRKLWHDINEEILENEGRLWSL